MSADALPTVQVNGVVWSQAIVGNTVYAAGKFTKARPAGTSAGSAKEVDRANILAYDITTGKLTSFKHTLNGQALRVVASPDGKRVYVGGDFTTVDGQTRNRVAAFTTADGKLVPGFHPNVSGKVRAIAATNTTVYIGGNFFSVNGTARTRLAAIRSVGGLLPWHPTADDNEVFALLIAPGGKRVIVGGRFQKLNGAQRVGIGALDPDDSGASLPWSSNPIPAKSGSNFSYVTDLVTDGTNVYGSADGEGRHWFDGRFAVNPANGDLIWLDNCYGATYGVFVTGKALYSVGHAHDCSSLNAFPETTPTTYQRTLAETTYKTGTDKTPPGSNSNYSRQPIPTLLHWFPTLSMGSYTGQNQAAWAITGNSKYIALAGEFPKVNGVAQQGLVRFAISSVAPDKRGPIAQSTLKPSAGSFNRRVYISWKATWDQDNNQLTYRILRGSTVVKTITQGSAFWNRPTMKFTDTGLTRGAKHTYKIRVTDPAGNTITSAGTTITVR